MRKTIVFDLDDTLYKEIDYVFSGFSIVADFISKNIDEEKSSILTKLKSWYQKNQNPFENLISQYGLEYSLSEILDVYRNHVPDIVVDEETLKTLDKIRRNNVSIGLITDGRSVQQRNKIKSLGLEKFIDRKIISEEFGSEKPAIANYTYFMDENDLKNTIYFYVGDNIEKDFISPNKLGWTTICLKDNGQNIHKQNFKVEEEYLPKHIVTNILEIIPIINEK